jgi:DNA-binding NarL/FixJ family response regulator
MGVAGRKVPDEQLRTIIAVSNPVSRCGLESMLRESPNVAHVTMASDAGEAADDVRSDRFDLVIASTDMVFDESPGLLEATRAPGVQLLLMLRGQDRDDITRATLANADGYLVEEELTPQVLSETIRRLARGEMVLTKSFVQTMLVRSHEVHRIHPMQALTQRERHVLRLLVDGLSNKQIATKLSISEHGAKRHVANLLAKLNCANRTHAVALALQEGLLNV